MDDLGKGRCELEPQARRAIARQCRALYERLSPGIQGKSFRGVGRTRTNGHGLAAFEWSSSTADTTRRECYMITRSVRSEASLEAASFPSLTAYLSLEKAVL